MVATTQMTVMHATYYSPVKLSTVTIKYVGCQHEPSAQEIPEVVSELLDEGEVVPVNIFPEEKQIPLQSSAG